VKDCCECGSSGAHSSKNLLWTGLHRLRPLAEAEISANIVNPQIDQMFRYLNMLPEPKEGRENKECEDERRATRQYLESKGYY